MRKTNYHDQGGREGAVRCNIFNSILDITKQAYWWYSTECGLPDEMNGHSAQYCATVASEGEIIIAMAQQW